MNVLDVLKYGHATVLASLDGVAQSEWLEPGVCGVWSVRDIVAHLASYEHLLLEILATLGGEEPSTPCLSRLMAEGPEAFNDYEVAQRQALTAEAALAEYCDTYDSVMAYATRLPAETYRQNGILPWYGAEYDLDDFLVYSFYGHKREHMAQVDHFRDILQGSARPAA